MTPPRGVDGPTPASDAAGSGELQLVVLRVWWEHGDDAVRGRLIAPALPHPRSGHGQAQLLALVARALQRLDAQRHLAEDDPVTRG